FVEVPFVEEEEIKRLVQSGQPDRYFRTSNVELIRKSKTQDHRDGRQPPDELGNMMHLLDDLVLGRAVKRGAPEQRLLVTDEVSAEQESGRDRSSCQNIERDQHHVRAFVNM